MGNNRAFMSGIPEFAVLCLLADREMYGYEIGRAILRVTREALSVGEGVLYPALHALEAQGLLHSRSMRAEGRTRIYYRLTPRGRARLARLQHDWQQVRSGVDALLGAPHGA